MDEVTVTKTERERLHDDIERIRLTLMSEEEESDDSDVETEQKFVIDGDGRIVQASGFAQTQENAEPVPGTSGIQAARKDHVSQEAVHGVIDDETLPQTPKVCLALNHTYQGVIRENLECIQMMLTLNREKQSLLKADMELSGIKKQIPQSSQKFRHNFCVPYIKSSKNMTPPPNPDTLAKKANKEINVYTQREESTWTGELLDKLKEAVKADRIMHLTRPFLNKKNLLYEKLKEEQGDAEEIKKLLGELDQQIIAAKYTTSEDDLYGDPHNCDDIDWLKISNVDMDGSRSAINCQMMWQNAAHPKINKEKWTKEEDEALLVLADEFMETNWQLIANKLGTGRNAFQCLQRYQSKVNPCLHTGRWMPTEDKILLECIEHCSRDDTINWTQVANCMEGRTVEQCTRRWDELQKSYRRGRWSEEEDIRLMAAVEMFGTLDWHAVAEFVPGRSTYQCRERWINVLDTNLKHGSWNYLEDRLIMMKAKELNYGWTAIAEFLPGRTDAMVSARYKVMMRWKEQRDYLRSLPGYSDEMLKKVQDGTVTVEQRMQQVMSTLKKVKQGGSLSLPTDMVARVAKTPTQSKVENILKQVWSQQDLEKLHKMKDLKEVTETDLQIAAIRLHDLEQGIDVPQPPLALNLTRNFIKKIEARSRVHGLIQQRIEAALQSKPKALSVDHNALAAQVSRIFFAQDQTPREERIAAKVNKLKDATTVSNMFEIINEVKYLMKRRCGRKQKTDKHKAIQNEILRLLSNRVSKGRRGRPRKFVVDNVSQEEKADPERIKELDNKVLQLMFKALNVDLKECMHNGLENMDLAAELQHKRGAKKCASMDEIGTDLAPVLQIGKATGAFTEDDEMAVKIQLPDNRTARKGDAAVIYNTPLLPPNHGTLAAFKQLLLQRHTLKEQMSAKERSKNDKQAEEPAAEPITSADINPSLCRKMPGFAVKDLLAAKRRLLHKEQHGSEDDDGGRDTPATTVSDTSSASKKSSLAVDTTLKSNLLIAQRTHDYQLLRARMRSMFLWPALLSTIKPPPKPDPVSEEASDMSSKQPQKKKPGGNRPLLHTKRWRRLNLQGAKAKEALVSRIRNGIQQSKERKEKEAMNAQDEDDKSTLAVGDVVPKSNGIKSAAGKGKRSRKKQEAPTTVRQSSRQIRPPKYLEVEGKKPPKPKMKAARRRREREIPDGLPLAVFPAVPQKRRKLEGDPESVPVVPKDLIAAAAHTVPSLTPTVGTLASSHTVPAGDPLPTLSSMPSGLASPASVLTAHGTPMAATGLVPVAKPPAAASASNLASPVPLLTAGGAPLTSLSVLPVAGVSPASNTSATAMPVPMVMMLPGVNSMNYVTPLNTTLPVIPAANSMSSDTNVQAGTNIVTMMPLLARTNNQSLVTQNLVTINPVLQNDVTESQGQINDTSNCEGLVGLKAESCDIKEEKYSAKEEDS